MRTLALALALVPVPTIVTAEPADRFGIDGSVSAGPIFAAGGSVRGEHPLGPHHALVGRLEYLTAVAIESEGGPAASAVSMRVGDRRYWGNFYLAGELGVSVIYRPAYYDVEYDDMHAAKTTVVPAALAGLGGKVGAFDIGLEVVFPAVGVGVHLGIDLGTW